MGLISTSPRTGSGPAAAGRARHAVRGTGAGEILAGHPFAVDPVMRLGTAEVRHPLNGAPFRAGHGGSARQLGADLVELDRAVRVRHMVVDRLEPAQDLGD